MYKLKNFKVLNTDPWETSIEKRIKQLFEKSDFKKVVYIYEKADSSTFRYRVYNMCQSLEYSKKYVGTYFFEEEVFKIEEYLDKIDLVIFVRVRWSLKMNNFLGKIKKQNIPVLFDTDDLVFDVSSIPLIMNTLNVDFNNPENYSYWFSYVSRLWFMGSLCDGFICTNEFLSARILKIFRKPVFAINNFLNHEQIDISNKLFEEKIKKDSEKPFTIGYFSGTPSHINDFRLVSSEMEELLKKYKDIVLEVAGYMELPDHLSYLVDQKRIIHTDFVDFITLQKKIAEVDVNIVPLVENKFTNCKSELKFFEAAIVGTVTCATPTFTYKNSIVDEKTGFLCKEGGWYKVVEDIYRKKTDKKIIFSANKYCLENYSPEKQTKKLEMIFAKLIKS